MKAFLESCFRMPEDGKISDRFILTRLIVSVTVVVFCLVAMSMSAYAYFSHSVTSSVNIIQAADFDIIAEVEGQTGTDGVFLLEVGQTYKVTLTKGGTASTGFCVMEITLDGDTTVKYHTQQLYKQDGQNSMTFTLSLPQSISDSEKVKVTFKPHWGTSHYYGYENPGDFYIINGASVSAQRPVKSDSTQNKNNVLMGANPNTTLPSTGSGTASSVPPTTPTTPTTSPTIPTTTPPAPTTTPTAPTTTPAVPSATGTPSSSNPVISLELTGNAFVLTGKGSTVNLYNGQLDPGAISWTTSDEKIATVANGIVTVVSNGIVTVTAEYEGQTATCVIRSRIYALSVADNMIKVGDSFTLKMYLVDENGDKTQIDASELKFYTNEKATEFISVDENGLVTGLKNNYNWLSEYKIVYVEYNGIVLQCKVFVVSD